MKPEEFREALKAAFAFIDLIPQYVWKGSE